MRNVTFTVVTAAIAFTLHASAAWPCSPGEVSGVSPVDGAADVPTNAALFFAMGDVPTNATLVDEESGVRTELVFTFASPVTEVELVGLAPSRSYRVELDLFENASGVLEPGRTLRFSTSAAADEDAPTVETVDARVSSETIPGGLTFGEGCSLAPLPYWREERVQSLVTFDLELSPDVALVRLFRIVDGERAERGVTFTNGATAVQISDVTSDVGEVTYRIIAVDTAGNESSEDLEQSLGEEPAGCTQMNTQASATTAAPIVAALVLLRVRRRSIRTRSLHA